MLIGILVLALLLPFFTSQKVRRPRYVFKKDRIVYHTRKKPKMHYVAKPKTRVSTRVYTEYSIFYNDGRWTEKEDGIYLEPESDTIYIIAGWPGVPQGPEQPNDIWEHNSHIFGVYRRYANLVCPTTVEARLADPEFRAKFEKQYQRAKLSRKEILNKDLSFEQYLDEVPNCDVNDSFWNSVIRFIHWDAELGATKLMIQFSGNLSIKSFLNWGGDENYLPLLKSYLRREGRLLYVPLAQRNPPHW